MCKTDPPELDDSSRSGTVVISAINLVAPFVCPTSQITLLFMTTLVLFLFFCFRSFLVSLFVCLFQAKNSEHLFQFDLNHHLRTN